MTGDTLLRVPVQRCGLAHGLREAPGTRYSVSAYVGVGMR